jgi:protein phosphatase
VEVYGLSDVGRARTHNEDSFAIDRDLGLIVVADGMGGHEHGEVASELAVRSIREAVEAVRLEPVRDDAAAMPHTRALHDAVESAHAQVLAAIERDAGLTGMGTTVVAMWFRNGVAAVAHVGDSRAYRVGAAGLERLTEDHSWVREQVAAGHLSEAQAREHPLRNVVTQALGGVGAVAVAVGEQEAEPGDVFLLCSDGLTSMLDDAEIAASLTPGESLEDQCRELVRQANERGGLDNVTVVLVRVPEP